MAGSKSVRGLEKAPTGIQGFDEITQGGLPKGRPTLICGGPGSGKTMFGLDFLSMARSGIMNPASDVFLKKQRRS